MSAPKLILVAAFMGLMTGPAVAGGDCRPSQPSVLQLPPGFQPEGITRGRGATLLVAGFANGGIYALDARTGKGSYLVAPQSNGRKAVGLKLQRETNQIFVAGGDTGHAYVYDARTGASLADLVLAEVTPTSPSFVNDVILGDDAAYFTDSFRSVFYRVALGCKGNAPEQEDVETIALGGDYQAVDGFNANGIELTPKGDLLIVNGATGVLYRVDPSSGDADAVDLGTGSVTNGDGLVLRGRTLYVVENFSNQLAVVELGRRFNRGEVVRTIANPNFDIPATAAFFDDALYVTNARFTTPPTPDTIYTVVRVPVEP